MIFLSSIIKNRALGLRAITRGTNLNFNNTNENRKSTTYYTTIELYDIDKQHSNFKLHRIKVYSIMFWHVGTSIALLVFSDQRQQQQQRTFSSSTSFKAVTDDIAQTTTTTTTTTSSSIQVERYNDLLGWVQSNGGEINDKIVIQKSSQGDGYGAVVNGSVEKDEILFTIPRSACLTLDKATNDGEFGETFQKIIEKAGPGGNTVVMAGYMAKEYLLLMEELKKEEQQPAEEEGSSSSSTVGGQWGAYFQTLPWKRGVNNQEHVLFWKDEKIEELLKGSLCYNEAISLREEVALATKVMNSIVGNSIRKARGEEVDGGGFSWPWEAKPTPEGPPEGFSEAVTGAFVCLLTRAFQDGDGDEEKLVPLLDMLQHSDTPNVRHAMRKSDGTVEVRARSDIAPGQELFNQYRSEEEESMPYSRFFTRFGFVPGIQEDMENLLRDKSSIFYPQKAEI